MTARVCFIAHAPTPAQRTASFPLDEDIENRDSIAFHGGSLKVPQSDQAWSAPEKRACQTSHMLGLNVEISNELRDCEFGSWRGKTIAAVEAEDPDGLLAWLRDPNSTPHGGESVEQLIRRVGAWLDDQSCAKRTNAVTHPSVIKAAVVHSLGLPMKSFWRVDVAPLSLTDLRFNRNVWTVRCVGCSLNACEPSSNETF
jgi:broad specificity phosphatase PhoE